MKKKLFYLLIVGAIFTLSSCDYLSSIIFNQEDATTDFITEEIESGIVDTEERISSTSERKVGYINDPDGYTNVRKEKSSKSEVLFQIYENERFDIQNNEGDWWLIKFNDNYGYIHNSRVTQIN